MTPSLSQNVVGQEEYTFCFKICVSKICSSRLWLANFRLDVLVMYYKRRSLPTKRFFTLKSGAAFRSLRDFDEFFTIPRIAHFLAL